MNAPRVSGVLVSLLTLATFAGAANPNQSKDRVKLIGQPASIEVQPKQVSLNGPRGVQQVLVTGKYADGTVRRSTSAFS